jgi:SAM-dependent methyltransferase
VKANETLSSLKARLGGPSPLTRWRHRRNPVRTREELQDYWRSPDAENPPESYLEGRERSEFLLSFVEAVAEPDSSLLEIGCNVGRNLAFLHEHGYRGLNAIEINAGALEVLRLEHPAMAADATFHNEPVEEAIKRFADDEFDVVFTMAVLEHLHQDSDWVFAEMARIARHAVITIEDEKSVHWRAVPRNYRTIFEGLGMSQSDERWCTDVPGLGSSFCARVFQPA